MLLRRQTWLANRDLLRMADNGVRHPQSRPLPNRVKRIYGKDKLPNSKTYARRLRQA
jgi:hypothetical protein